VSASPFVWGVILGAAAYWFLYGSQPMTQAGVGGTVPKPLRREGRRLKGVGARSRPSYWPFGTTRG
jgi:hypothetical protein